MTLWGKIETLNKKINLKLSLFMIQNGRHIFCFWLATPDVNMPPPPKKNPQKSQVFIYIEYHWFDYLLKDRVCEN